MSASPSDRRSASARLAQALIRAWIVFGPAVALGQQPGQALGPPISLLPRPPPEMSVPVFPRGEDVASKPLAPPAPGWSAGTGPREGLPETLWHGTTRAMAEFLLARLPEAPSPALQSLVRRLLLSRAAAPDGFDEGDHNLPALRASALLRLGELTAARAVVAAVPESERGPVLPLAVSADAISGDVARACATVHEAVRRDQNAFWETSLIACQALQGETEQANLGLQILAEEQGPRSEALAAAVDALAGRPAPATIDRAGAFDPLTLRLLIKAQRELAPALVDTLRPDLALCLALDEEAPAVTRLVAAERAARLGALPADRLRALYSGLTGAGKGGERALDHARRSVAIGQAATATERMTLITHFADTFGGPQSGGFFLAARLVLPALRGIAPDPNLAGSAPAAARLLIAAGDYRAARRWSALTSGEEARLLDLLLALAAGRQQQPFRQTEVPQNLVFTVLSSAIGEPQPPTAWTRLPETAWAAAGSPSPPPAAWLDLTDAARAKRVGETVLAVVMVASPAGTLSADPVGLFTAVSSLRQIGLEADARRLAVEAALAAGL